MAIAAIWPFRAPRASVPSARQEGRMTYRSTAAILAASLLLGACSGQSDNEAAANGAEDSASTGATGASGPALAALQPGEWETTVEILRMEMPGMPAGMPAPAIPATTTRHCVTPEEAAQPPAEFFAGNPDNSACQRENFTIGNGRVSGIIICSVEGTTVRSEMEGQFSSTGFEMTSRTQTTAQDMTMNGETRIRSQRVGDCAAS
ncbi:MAG: DUF3617 domain-containing protein [Sphingomonas sp.]|nr:DUF3617 domain-containing protein [Sphingomonas sp.]